MLHILVKLQNMTSLKLVLQLTFSGSFFREKFAIITEQLPDNSLLYVTETKAEYNIRCT